MNSFFFFLIWLGFLIILSRCADKVFSDIFPRRSYRFLIALGVIVHEFSHAVVGKLFGAKIKDISLFSKTGGSVTHTKTRIPIIGNVLTSLAPLFGSTIALFAVTYFFNFYQEIFPADNWSNGADSLFLSIGFFWKFFLQNFGNWKWWIFLYFVFSLTVTIAPSNQDFKNAWFGIAFLIMIIFVLFSFDKEIQTLEIIFQTLTPLFVFGVTFEIFTLIFIFPFWFFFRKK